MSLLETNAGSKGILGKKLLIYGSCIKEEHKDLFKVLSAGKTALGVCLEREHVNMIVYKLATVLKLNKPPKEITVLTVDGSPHCVQLHYAIEETKKLVGSNINVKHVVVSNGKPVEVDRKTVKLSRYLAKIQKLIEK